MNKNKEGFELREGDLKQVSGGARHGSISVSGTVEERLSDFSFFVILENGVKIEAHLSGFMRMRRKRLTSGDQVTVEMSPDDNTRGRIVSCVS